jgi:hypothetical protein
VWSKPRFAFSASGSSNNRESSFKLLRSFVNLSVVRV